MARIKYTEKGYSYIECNVEECLQWGGIGVCDYCGQFMKDKIYLIYILNSAYCPKCFEEWKKRSIRDEDDIKLQKLYHLRYYKNYKVI